MLSLRGVRTLCRPVRHVEGVGQGRLEGLGNELRQGQGKEGQDASSVLGLREARLLGAASGAVSGLREEH